MNREGRHRPAGRIPGCADAENGPLSKFRGQRGMIAFERAQALWNVAIATPLRFHLGWYLRPRGKVSLGVKPKKTKTGRNGWKLKIGICRLGEMERPTRGCQKEHATSACLIASHLKQEANLLEKIRLFAACLFHMRFMTFRKRKE